MKAFLLVITLLIPLQAAAQEVEEPLGRYKTEVEGVWQTGERFRARLFYRRDPIIGAARSDKPILSDQPPGAFTRGWVELHIYSIDRDGTEKLAVQNHYTARFSDSGNFFITPYISTDEDGSLVVRTRSNMHLETELTIIKRDEEIIVSVYYAGPQQPILPVPQDQKVPYELLGNNLKLCAVDLLSGQRNLNGHVDMVELPGVIRLEDWSEDTIETLGLCPLE